jgi:RNA polymerase sigma-H factor
MSQRAVISRSQRLEAADPTDEELVAAYQEGHSAAIDPLLARYRQFARNRARRYFLQGSDTEDIVQEAMIGLYKAIRDFDPVREIAFRPFADVCITRHLISAVKTANRTKHSPLNSYISLVAPLSEDMDTPLEETLDLRTTPDPAEVVVSLDEARAMRVFLDGSLSALETEVTRLYLEGFGLGEIAQRLERTTKCVDNALQRIRRKLERRLAEEGRS